MSARTMLLALPVVAALLPGIAAAAPRTGQQVVEEQCVACHAIGLDGAPRIGDARAWQPRAARGLSSLTAAALEGVRKMPPHGGKLSLTDLEISRAIAYMVNQSGGSWTEPLDRAHVPAARSGAAIVQGRCGQCHGTGVGGAPRIGDREAWIGRARAGLDSLVGSAIRGHGGMPARGGMADLTDAEMRSAVTYMFQQSVKPRP